MQGSLNGDLAQGSDWLCSVSPDAAVPVSSTYPATASTQGKSRLVSLRGYPTRRPLERRASNGMSSAPASVDVARATSTAVPVSTYADHATLSMQAFLHRLRGYHTFQPLFTNNPAYPILLEGSRAAADPAHALAYVDRMLDASENQLLRHQTDGRFTNMVETLTSAPGRYGGAADNATGATKGLQATARPLAVVDVTASRAAASTAAAGDELELVATATETQHVLHSTQRNSDAGINTTWEPKRSSVGSSHARGGTAATANANAKLLEHQRAWEGNELERHRVQRTRYLENLHLEIEVLERQTLSAPRTTSTYALHAQEGRVASTCESVASEATAAAPAADGARSTRPTAVQAAQERAALMEAQRAAWLAFQTSEGGELPPAAPARTVDASVMAPSKAVTAANWSAAAPSALEPSYALTVLSASAPSSRTDDVHNWLYGNWSHRTHRHENAALTIQRAYRVFRAKRTVYRRACARELAFQESLRAELTIRLRWLEAERFTPAEPVDGDAAQSRARATRFVADKLTARAALRRKARAQAQSADAELRQYAATTIQRVFRGHLARVEAHCLRSPRYRQEHGARRLNYAAAVIQRRWRRCRPALLEARHQQSAQAIQRWYRGCVARRELSCLRTAAVCAEEVRVQRYSVAVLERFFLDCLARKHAFYRAHKHPIDCLQRCGRGYMARASFMRDVWTRQFKPVVAVMEKARTDVLAVRRAEAVAQVHREARAAQYAEWVRADAALTIQRAWRLHTCIHRTSIDEL